MHKNELLSLLEEFGQKLNTARYNQYIPKLRDFFIEYVYEKYSSDTLEDTLCNNFNKNDLLLATVQYIEKNTNVKKVSAIDDFLIAVGEFFDKVIFEKYSHPSLKDLRPFVQFKNEVMKHKDRNKYLEDREKYPALNDDEYIFIIKHLNTIKLKSLVQQQSYIIVKLMLVFGLSLNRIKKIELNQFNKDNETLIISYLDNNIELKIDSEIAERISKYLLIRNPKLDNVSLFVTTKNNEIANNFCYKFIKDIQKKYEKEKNIIANFTPTGFIKYALIQMITSDVDLYALSIFTDNKDTVLLDCYERLSYSMSNHINNQYSKLNKS